LSTSRRGANRAGAGTGQKLGFALFRIGLEVARAYEQELAPLHLRHEHAGVLLTVGHGGPLHIRALARHLGANPQTIVNAVDTLEARRAVERTPAAGDARVVLVQLTRAGRALLRQVEDASERMDARLAHIGNATERADVLRYLHAVAEAGVLGERVELAPADSPRTDSERSR
jgi:MarR family transcriptional regulator, lower aerobic nicotinate degradation pathway regulator